MKKGCENCKSFYSSPFKPPCASCGDEHSNFSPRYILIDWIKIYAENKVGPAHTAIIKMIEDWEKCNSDTD